MSHTSAMSPGLVNSAAPIPPLIENDFGQPILMSTAATSLHLKEQIQQPNSGSEVADAVSPKQTCMI